MPRAGDLGIEIGELPPGRYGAITDCDGVRVGHSTLIEGDDVRTGVTVVVPDDLPLFAGSHRLNGNGELTGLEWVRESGFLTTPIAITNTFSVGVVRDAIASAAADQDEWALPVVGETYDGFLNDARGQHVTAEHARQALADAHTGPVKEGNIGGGTGMICHGCKGGIGVQANHGRRRRLRVNGVPIPSNSLLQGEGGSGSIIGIVATGAPLLPHQCSRLAQRAALGVGRMGGLGENSSGDIFLAFATGNSELGSREAPIAVRMLPNERIDPLFEAVVDATEEAILNALLAAETMTGRNGHTVEALDPSLVRETLRRP
jgi:D-aminopeptidase